MVAQSNASIYALKIYSKLLLRDNQFQPIFYEFLPNLTPPLIDEIEKINKLAASLSDNQKNILKIFNDNDTFMMIDLRLKELADGLKIIELIFNQKH